MFRTIRPFPGVSHITDAMGVSFTLIEGRKRALLFDTGYGTEDVAAYVRALTGKPLTVFLSHGHHDHVLGARWFERTMMCEEDAAEFRVRTGPEQRMKVKAQAESSGVAVPPDFTDAPILLPEAISFSGNTGEYENRTENLGENEAIILHVPGHTPGSIVIYVPEYGLLLTGDDWNPCTWMWFPSSMAADTWRGKMRSLVRTLDETYGKGVRHVLCSHQPMLREGQELKAYLDYMTEGLMRSAPAVDMGAPVNTHMIRNEGKDWTLIFDADKIKSSL